MNKTMLKIGGIILVGAGTALAYTQYSKRKRHILQEQSAVEVIEPSVREKRKAHYEEVVSSEGRSQHNR